MFENQGRRGVLGLPFRRLINGRPGGARTRTSLLLPGAPSGHVFSGFHGAVWYNSRSSHMPSVFIRVTAGANFTGLYPVYQIPRYRMRNFTCRPLYLPPYPTNAPFGIWHLLRTAHSGLKATLPIAFDGWVSIPFSSTGREIQIGYNLQKWFLGGRGSFAPCFDLFLG